jgi:NADH dehydrogenase
MQNYPLVTIVGGSGFIGRHTVKRFASAGWRVRVLVRDTVKAEFLKMAGYPGQVVLDHADITRPETLEGKFAGSDAVVNLVGILYQSGRQKFDRVHVEGAKAVAQGAAKAGAKALVQVSALAHGAEAHYAETKLKGEAAARAAFPATTILRPSLVVGPEDNFFQRFARMNLLAPALPLIGGGTTKFQPLLVTDLTQAIFNVATSETAQGKTYELAGPETYTLRQLFELIGSTTKRCVCLLPLPSCVAGFIGSICDLLPLPPLVTKDQVRMLKTDSVVSDGAEGFAALGVTPTPITEELPTYLSRFVKA